MSSADVRARLMLQWLAAEHIEDLPTTGTWALFNLGWGRDWGKCPPTEVALCPQEHSREHPHSRILSGQPGPSRPCTHSRDRDGRPSAGFQVREAVQFRPGEGSLETTFKSQAWQLMPVIPTLAVRG